MKKLSFGEDSVVDTPTLPYLSSKITATASTSCFVFCFGTRALVRVFGEALKFAPCKYVLDIYFLSRHGNARVLCTAVGGVMFALRAVCCFADNEHTLWCCTAAPISRVDLAFPRAMIQSTFLATQCIDRFLAALCVRIWGQYPSLFSHTHAVCFRSVGHGHIPRTYAA